MGFGPEFNTVCLRNHNQRLRTGRPVGVIIRLLPVVVVACGFVYLLRSAIAAPRRFCLSGSRRAGVINSRGAVNGLNVRIVVIHDFLF